jgi:phage host-nuclease inhibitor protein Gam
MERAASDIVLHRLVASESDAPDGAHDAEQDVRSELNDRQDEALRLLDELNDRIEAVIRDYAPAPAIVPNGPTPQLPAGRTAA